MKEKINDLASLQLAAEDAAERAIFEHAHLISESAKREIWASGRTVTALREGKIIEIAPDGKEKIIGKSTTARRVKAASVQTRLKAWK